MSGKCKNDYSQFVPGFKIHKWTLVDSVIVARGWQWNVRCECGRESRVKAAVLVSGHSKSCRWCRTWKHSDTRKTMSGGKTLEECAVILGITKEGVRQVEKRALQKIQLKLLAYIKTDFPQLYERIIEQKHIPLDKRTSFTISAARA